MITEDQIIAENEVEQMNDFFKMVGFDDQKIEDHKQRLGKIIYASIINDLEKLTAFKEKQVMPEIAMLEDLRGYYEQYLDKETFDKIITENVGRIYSEYFGAIIDELK